MKNKIIGSLCLLLMTLSAEAQTEKGSLLLGGSTSMHLDFNKNNKPSYRLNFNPNAGVFLVDNFAVGGAVNLSFYGADGYNEQGLGLSTFSRYYFETKKAKIKPYVGGGFGVTNRWYKGEARNMRMNAHLGAGVAYFVNDNVSLDVGLRYNYWKEFGVPDASVGYTTFNMGFQVHLARGKKKD